MDRSFYDHSDLALDDSWTLEGTIQKTRKKSRSPYGPLSLSPPDSPLFTIDDYDWDKSFSSFDEETHIFQSKPVHRWNTDDVTDWLVTVCNKIGIDFESNITGFIEYTGEQLLAMSQKQFRNINYIYGPQFHSHLLQRSQNDASTVSLLSKGSYNTLEELCHNKPRSHVSPHNQPSPYNTSYPRQTTNYDHSRQETTYCPSNSYSPVHSLYDPTNSSYRSPSTYVQSETRSYPDSAYRLPNEDSYNPCTYCPNGDISSASWNPEGGAIPKPDYPMSMHEHSWQNQTRESTLPLQPLPFQPDDVFAADAEGNTLHLLESPRSNSASHREPQSSLRGTYLPISQQPSSMGHPLPSPDVNNRLLDMRLESPEPPESDDRGCSTPTGRRQRGPKLWEFLLQLLDDSGTNPSLIRWENEAEGVFRLMQPDQVASRWGHRRSASVQLSYDYFARALRYHYKSGVLISVPERKLVYKFGAKVWPRTNP